MQFVICSKSTWHPAIRREHAIARSAAAAGDVVVFLERPLDARSLGSHGNRMAWARGLLSVPSDRGLGIQVVPQSTLVPGHRSAAAQRLDMLRLMRALRSVPGQRHSVVVACAPWHWPAVAAAPAARRVFDCAKGWRLLIPDRAEALERLYRRIAAEADAVVLAAAELAGEFPGARVSVVRNGVDPLLMRTPVTPAPPERRLVYAGTLSERFDAGLLDELLVRLPGWTAELYGQCQYAGRAQAPAAELERVLRRHRGRLRWLGPVERPALASMLDRGRVLIAPHRAVLARGQDSMKLYDYAARRRPIVASPGALGRAEQTAGAGVIEAAGAEAFADAVSAADVQMASRALSAGATASWLNANSWEARWPLWRASALGQPESGS